MVNILLNPTTHSIMIKGEKNINQEFSIYDQMGREVFKGKLKGITTEVNLSILSKGIYTLKIEENYQPAQIVKE
ncbi:MAG: T9SS type A sorting domain-containing protein [Bacteroidota bacterium]